MITRLKIQGFKNIFDAEIFFGPFTCIAGLNSVGKSNLFDALQFLSNTTEHTLIEAAAKLRSNDSVGNKITDITSIFYNDQNYAHDTIYFEVDLLIPENGIDHLGQEAKATTTAVRYILEIKLSRDISKLTNDLIQISKEELLPIKRSEMLKSLKDLDAKKDWVNSVLKGMRRNSTPFFLTNQDENVIVISKDQTWGRKKKLNFKTLPRTVLSTASSTEMPTALIAKLELKSWMKIQFEASSLRSADEFFNPNPFVSTSGAHLPAALYRLTNDSRIKNDVLTEIANRLNELIDNVFKINIDVDEKRNLLTLTVKGKNKAEFPASSLSDGTLRFLALSIIEQDPSFTGIICLEEPENGIHPERIPAIVNLLYDISLELNFKNDIDNPLRQVIINTHSPLVVAEVKAKDLIFAEEVKQKYNDNIISGVRFKPLSGTWRAKKIENQKSVSKSVLLKYLNPYFTDDNSVHPSFRKKADRVLDRTEVRQLSFFNIEHEND